MKLETVIKVLTERLETWKVREENTWNVYINLPDNEDANYKTCMYNDYEENKIVRLELESIIREIENIKE